MSHLKSAPPGRLSLCLLLALLLTSLISSAALAQNEATVGKKVRCLIEIYGLGPVEFTDITGPCQILYSDPYVDPDMHISIDTEILGMELADNIIFVSRNEEVPSPGVTRSIEPGIDFPAESFFDVMYEIELPDHFPGDYLINYEPMHLMSVVDQFPPYNAHYMYAGAPIILYNTAGIDVGAILEWEEQISVYYPPEAHIACPAAYKSEVALLNEEGLVELPASLSGIPFDEIEYAVFSCRPLGGEWTDFYTDYSGEGTWASTKRTMGTGDGWCGYFDPGSDPFDGQVYDFQVEFFTSRPGPWIDTCSIWVDPTPPIPWILPEDLEGDPETLRVYQVESFFDITFEVPDELPAPGPAELQAFPLTQRFERTLTPVDQLGLGTDLDSMSCGPASAASCLKYFAENGYPDLDNEGGDPAKPEQSGEDIARGLQGPMGTDGEHGTSGDGMVAGIESYLRNHGQSGWSVSGHPVESDADLAAMFREFEADSEDVMVLLQDTITTGENAGDTTGHWVTLGSREQIQHSADSTSQKIDFMDPWGGGSTADNNYDIGEDDSGNATTEGYDLDGDGADAWIAGYVKVSPPEGGATPGMRMPGAPAFDPNWIPLDAGTFQGNGLVDTLHWDTHGFAPGLYLLEVITTNHQGHTCRNIRLCLLTEPSTDSDPGTPGLRNGLHGSYPNPFNPSTSIVFSLAEKGPVTLAVYDVAGRRIRTLIDAKVTEAGVHTVKWDGQDDHGRSVSSGVYFCRFVDADNTESTKMILLR